MRQGAGKGGPGGGEEGREGLFVEASDWLQTLRFRLVDAEPIPNHRSSSYAPFVIQVEVQ